jgi:hypothetical protein
LTTAEGDPLVFASALYRHGALDEILQRLNQAGDFDCDDSPEPGSGGAYQASWLETEPDVESSPASLGQRVLATLTVTPTTLKVETVSRRRSQACRKRLRQLLGDRIQLVEIETRRPEDAIGEPSSQPEPEPLALPPEVIAELEERMIRQWLDESIPALGGLTPREAAKTPKGRKRLDALLDDIAGRQGPGDMPPGMFSPDYRKAKKMLGLE